jgi:hypothetical protein
MKKFYLSILFLFPLFKSLAQQWEWARKADNTTGHTSVNKIRADGLSNIYLYGSSESNIQFGSTMLNAGHFIVKLDSNGTALWARSIIYSGSGSYTAKDFCVDLNGNILLAIQFSGTMNILSFTFVSSGYDNIAIIKFDSAGLPLWGRRFGNSLTAWPGSVAVDNEMNIYLTGSFEDSITFDSFVFNNPDNHFFLAKFNPSGQTIWATTGDSCLEAGLLIKLDRYNNIYAISTYGCHLYGTGIAKFDSSGNILSRQYVWSMYDFVPDFVIDDYGNIIALHNGIGHYGYVPILAMYNPSMNLIWDKCIGTYYGCYQLGVGVWIDKLDNIFVCGSIGSEYCNNDSVYFQNQLTYVGQYSVPIAAKFDFYGNLIWTKTAISSSYDDIRAMCQSNTGNFYLTGPLHGDIQMGDTMIFDNYTLTSDGYWKQFFIAKLNPNNVTTSAEQIIPYPLSTFQLFPNPTTGRLTLHCPPSLSNGSTGSPTSQLNIYNSLGELVYNKRLVAGRNEIDLSGERKGIYFLHLINGEVRKIILN